MRPRRARDLLDLAVGDLGEALGLVDDPLDRGPVEVLDREQVVHAPASSAVAARDRDLVDAVELAHAHVHVLGARRSAGSCRRSRGGSAARGGRGRRARRAGPARGARSRTAPRSRRGRCGRCRGRRRRSRRCRPVDAKSRWEACSDRRVRAGRDVVAVEADVEVAERDLGVEQLLEQALQALARGRRRDGGCRRAREPHRRGCARRSRGRCA